VHADIRLRGRILLVEDGADNQRLLRMQLSEAGASVTSAMDGQVAVNLAAKQKFDLILMDMQMPVMDGYAATIELRRRGLTIPIIALTAYAMAEDREKCLAAGCTAYLSKPVREEKLLTTVHEYLRNDPSPMPDDSPRASSAASPPPASDAAGSDRIKSSFASDSRIMRIVPEFVAGLAAHVREMIDLLERSDLAGLEKVAHQLLGASGGYGFDAISQPASRVEQSIRAGKDLKSITAETKSLIDVIRRIDGYEESKAAVGG
jgi:CheY-like chemotaxis protein/HPt (histidine-containing phosphotransfer) domain-containing protein